MVYYDARPGDVLVAARKAYVKQRPPAFAGGLIVQASRCGRWVSWHLCPTSPVNVPSTCALGLGILSRRPDGAGRSFDVRTSVGFLLQRTSHADNGKRAAPEPRHAVGDLVADARPRTRLREPRVPAQPDGEIVRRAATRRWIACRLAYRGWYRTAVPRPGRYTGLFFLDDATAFAAGHGPCALCRRADYARVLAVLGPAGADAIDSTCGAAHADRVPRRRASLPDGAFVLLHDEPHLVVDARLRRGRPAATGRRAPRRRPSSSRRSSLVPVLAPAGIRSSRSSIRRRVRRCSA